METNTIIDQNFGAIEYTVGKSENNQADHTDLESENAQLRSALAASVQEQAFIQLEMANLVTQHQEDLEGMVKANGEDVGKILMDRIVETMGLINQYQDEAAYRLLETTKLEHGEQYGHADIDPLSPEALRSM